MRKHRGEKLLFSMCTQIELIQDEQSLPSAARAGMYNITLLGRCLRSFRVKGESYIHASAQLHQTCCVHFLPILISLVLF